MFYSVKKMNNAVDIYIAKSISRSAGEKILRTQTTSDQRETFIEMLQDGMLNSKEKTVKSTSIVMVEVIQTFGCVKII